MSLILLTAVALASGVGIGRWWVLFVPPVLGGAVAGGLAAHGASLADTPIAFLVVVAMVTTAVGVFLRSALIGRVG